MINDTQLRNEIKTLVRATSQHLDTRDREKIETRLRLLEDQLQYGKR